MDYVIGNTSKTLFVRMGESGQYTTCGKEQMQRFTQKKAQNIAKCLPKELRRQHFTVFSVPEKVDEDELVDVSEVKLTNNVIKTEDYEIPPEIKRWQEKVESCNGLAKEARSRKNYLSKQLSLVDLELENIYHEIELSPWKNVCDSYRCYKAIKLARQKRRIIKDELNIVTHILGLNLESIATKHVTKSVNGLGDRVYEFRAIE